MVRRYSSMQYAILTWFVIGWMLMIRSYVGLVLTLVYATSLWLVASVDKIDIDMEARKNAGHVRSAAFIKFLVVAAVVMKQKYMMMLLPLAILNFILSTRYDVTIVNSYFLLAAIGTLFA